MIFETVVFEIQFDTIGKNPKYSAGARKLPSIILDKNNIFILIVLNSKLYFFTVLKTT